MLTAFPFPRSPPISPCVRCLSAHYAEIVCVRSLVRFVRHPGAALRLSQCAQNLLLRMSLFRHLRIHLDRVQRTTPAASDSTYLAFRVLGHPSSSAIESFSAYDSARDDPNTRPRGRFRIACGSGERSEHRILPTTTLKPLRISIVTNFCGVILPPDKGQYS